MGKGGWGIGRLGLWMQLRRMAGQDSPPAPEIPQGPGPLLLVHVSADARLAFAQVQRRLMRARPDLRILDPGDPGPQAASALMRADPAALLLLGSDLPPVLISAASRHDVPVILAEARFAPDDAGWSLHARRRRELLRQARAILVTDPASQAIALRMGAGRQCRDRLVQVAMFAAQGDQPGADDLVVGHFVVHVHLAWPGWTYETSFFQP